MSCSVKTILYIEDEPSVLLLGSRILESFGYQILQAPDEETALSLYEQHSDRIDAILTDYSLPRMNGRALIDDIQARGYTGPVCYMSGFESSDVLNDADTAGFVQKPFTLESLREEVERILH